MNPNSTHIRRDAQADEDERFVAKYLEAQGMKAVKRDAVVLDLAAAPVEGAFLRANFPHWIRSEADGIKERASWTDGDIPRSALLRWIADQVEAQTKPPRIPEPGMYGVVKASCVHSEERHQWVRGKRGWNVIDSRRSEPDPWEDLIDPELVREGVA